MKEFFSGDIVSLARRFEIPRDVLNAIKDIEDPIARFAALKDVLAQFGINQELITAQTQTTAVAYDKLKGSADDATAALGQFFAVALKGEAEKLTGTLQSVTDGINSLSAAGDQRLAVEDTLLSASNSLTEFNTKVTTVNEQIAAGMQNNVGGWREFGLAILKSAISNIVISA